MNTASLVALSRILDEVSAHPVLRAKERAIAEEMLREDAMVESFLEAHLEKCQALADSPEAFMEGVAALTDHAMAAGMFPGVCREVVEEALTDAMLEFLPTLIKAAGAVGRGVGKAAGAVARGAGKVARGVGKAAAGAKAVGGAFKAGVKQGYHGKAGDSKPAPAPVQRKASGLAKKVASAAARSVQRKTQPASLGQKLTGRVGMQAGKAKTGAMQRQLAPKKAASALKRPAPSASLN